MIAFQRIINAGLRRWFTGTFAGKECTHLDLIDADARPSADVCEECVAMGADWPALRMCLICGSVGCCEDGNKHARLHYEETGHPLMKPYLEPRARWMWCYVDEALLDLPTDA
jgi:uncharacterized UBP type Zn finger protein